MALTVERLRQHYAANTVHHRRVYYFHAHAYFKPEHSAIGHEFKKKVEDTYEGDDRVEVHSLYEQAVGPHPLPMFETLFNRDMYTEFITWLQFERPEELSILIHPLTEKQVLDHTSRGLWLGPQPPGPYGGLNTAPLLKLNEKALQESWSEEDYAEKLKKH